MELIKKFVEDSKEEEENRPQKVRCYLTDKAPESTHLAPAMGDMIGQKDWEDEIPPTSKKLCIFKDKHIQECWHRNYPVSSMEKKNFQGVR